MTWGQLRKFVFGCFFQNIGSITFYLFKFFPKKSWKFQKFRKYLKKNFKKKNEKFWTFLWPIINCTLSSGLEFITSDTNTWQRFWPFDWLKQISSESNSLKFGFFMFSIFCDYLKYVWGQHIRSKNCYSLREVDVDEAIKIENIPVRSSRKIGNEF